MHLGTVCLLILAVFAATAQAKILRSYDALQNVMSLNAVIHVKQDMFFRHLYFRKLGFDERASYRLAAYDRQYESILGNGTKLSILIDGERFDLETMRLEGEVDLPFFLHSQIENREAAVPDEAVKALQKAAALRVIFTEEEGKEYVYDISAAALREWKKIIAQN